MAFPPPLTASPRFGCGSNASVPAVTVSTGAVIARLANVAAPVARFTARSADAPTLGSSKSSPAPRNRAPCTATVSRSMASFPGSTRTVPLAVVLPPKT